MMPCLARSLVHRYKIRRECFIRGLAGLLKFWFQTGLLADFIGSDSVKLFVPFGRNHLITVCVNSVFSTFSQKAEAVFF
jgi:hypothetical protein